jgi:CHAD domain-containing protein
MMDRNSVTTLQELAAQAIIKQNRRIFKYEAGVLKDQDPENLHQMRVGMRRLQSAIAGLDLAIELPKIVTVKNIAKIGHSLGKLRDSDVLLAALTNNYRPQLSATEQKNLDKVIKFIAKKRQHESKQVRKTLQSKLYLDLKLELNNWLEQPKYRVAGDYAVHFVLPDLLLPSVSQFLLHPGWLMGVKLKQGEIEFPASLTMDEVDQLLKSADTWWHDLRKSAKRTRYSLELFSQFYGESYHLHLKQIEAVQEILGQIQDIHVLLKILEKVLRSPITKKMPELADLLSKTRSQKWLEWQILQKQFLAAQTRTKFRQVTMSVANP